MMSLVRDLPAHRLLAARSADRQARHQKLALSSRDHLVESGTGWGGLAGLAASGAYCLRVKAVPTTVSASR
jgi:cyclopropane fatty-acyl-phospholipid synthase-like methyltransferase